MIEGNSPKWLFDIDSLTQSMNYVAVTACTISNESAGTQGELNTGTSEEISQDCIVMPIWKNDSYFDSPTMDIDNGEPKTADDAQKQVEDDPDIENAEQDKFEDDNSTKEVNAAGQYVNTASPDVNTGSLKLNTVGPSVNTTSSNEQDIPKDMFTMGVSHTLEATHIEFFSDEDEPEVDLGNITNSYTVPTTPNTRIHKDHPINNVIGDVKSSVQIRRMTKPTSEQGFLSDVYEQKTHDTLNTYLYACFLSQIEPTSIVKALSGSSWVEAMQEELLNKARLVSQGHRQEESIDYEELFAPVTRIEAIRLFLAYASFMGFLVYQMDVKSAFLYGTIEEEVYVTQPPGFKDPNHPDKVYKLVKALYGLHQAPRAWYETLSNYVLGNGFKRGKIDQTLFIKKQKGDILLVHVYVDDIIFGSTNKELCTGFEKLIKDKFQMSFLGELTFFLGLQVQQKEDGIFISQDKYVAEILKKFNYTDVKSALTPVDLEKPLVKDGDADYVDVYLYRSMIGSLMYLTASMPDIMFAVCACARFQVTPKTSHLLAVKRIFRYLKGKPTLGLWYFRDSPFELVAYTDNDITSLSSQVFGKQAKVNAVEMTWVPKLQLLSKFLSLEALFEGRSIMSICSQVWMEGYVISKVGDEAVHKELGDRMERAATTASSLEAEQDSGSGPRCQDTILGDVDAQTRFEITSKQSNDPPLSRGYTLGSGEDKNDRFAEIIDFLKSSSVHYALTVNPIIYTSCIEQFWATAKVQTVNGVCQLQALVDKKRVIITKSSIMSDLHLDDAEGTDCLPTATIFEELARMGAKSTAWNEFSSTMASLITCLERTQKFNLSKYIFDAMVKHLDGGVLDLEKAKDAQAKEIAALKNRIQRLERKKKSRTTGLKRLKKVGMSVRVESSEDKKSLGDHEDASEQGMSIKDIDADVEMHVEAKIDEKDEQSTKLDDSTTSETVTTASVEGSVAPTTINEITLAQTLIQIKVAKPKVVTTAATTAVITTTTTRLKVRGVIVQEPSGYKHNQLKSKSYEEIQKMFGNEMRRVNTFIPMDSEVVKSKKEIEESSKGTEDELESDKLKKAEGDKEKAKGSRKKMLGRKRARKEKQ
ncbi:putative ribonuclease H-like domain-containing protein [Tanacetum coccineum]